MKFDISHAMVSKKDLLVFWKRLGGEIEHIRNVDSLQDRHASLLMPNDETTLEAVNRVVQKQKKIHLLVIIGIGGSNLGTWAVQEAVLGKHYNATTTQTKVLYADTTDGDSLSAIQTIMAEYLKNNKNVLLNVVSKSGSTTETIANFEILLHVLKKYKKNWQSYVVVTTDHGSKLWNIALEQQFHCLAIPALVGGRYSVLSAVGLFPLAMLGVDILALRKGAQDMLKQCTTLKLATNIAAQSAIVHYYHYCKGVNISNTFLFSNDLERIGKWYRQLMGESIGKEFNRSRKKVRTGMTPTVAVGSTDLHSMVQLYLGGPYDKLHTFVTVQPNKDPRIPSWQAYNTLVQNIQGRKSSEVMQAILAGVKQAFAKQKRPYCEILLNKKSAHEIGQLLQFKMLEMMYLGTLLNVNPFDQENVEAYKIETRKILAHNV